MVAEPLGLWLEETVMSPVDVPPLDSLFSQAGAVTFETHPLNTFKTSQIHPLKLTGFTMHDLKALALYIIIVFIFFLINFVFSLSMSQD